MRILCTFSRKENTKIRFDKVKAKTALLVAGKTQSDLAESLELSRRWVGAAFNGGSISEKTARHIAAALGVSVESLMDGE